MAQPTHIGVPRKKRIQKIVTESPIASPTFTVSEECKHITTLCALCSHTLSMSQLQDHHYNFNEINILYICISLNLENLLLTPLHRILFKYFKAWHYRAEDIH